jgi:hypothetical protein
MHRLQIDLDPRRKSIVDLISPQEMPFGATFSIVQRLSTNDHAHAEPLGCSAQ